MADEDEDQDVQQDIAAAAAEAAGVDMGDYFSDTSDSYTDYLGNTVTTSRFGPGGAAGARQSAMEMLATPEYANTFNQARGITKGNPFGKNNFLSKYFGVDPRNIVFDRPKMRGTVFKDGVISRGGVNLGIPADVYNQQMALEDQYREWGKFANPYNIEGLPGYKQGAGGDIISGILRSGVSAGDLTVAGRAKDYRQPMSTGDLVASGIAAALLPAGGFLMDKATRVTGIEGQRPMIDGQMAGDVRGGILGGALNLSYGPAGERMLDKVSAVASEMIGGKKNTADEKLDSKALQDEFNRYNEYYNAPAQPSLMNVPGYKDEAERQRVRDAIMGTTPAETYQSPTLGGLATVPTTQVADAGIFQPFVDFYGNQALSPETRSWMESQGITYDQLMNKQIPAGTVMPNGQIYSPPVEAPMPVTPQNIGDRLRSIIGGSPVSSYDKPQTPANQAFDVAGANGFRTYQSQQGNQGGGFWGPVDVFGNPTGGARTYRGTGGTPTRSTTPSGSGGIMDTIRGMFTLNPYDRVG